MRAITSAELAPSLHNDWRLTMVTARWMSGWMTNAGTAGSSLSARISPSCSLAFVVAAHGTANRGSCPGGVTRRTERARRANRKGHSRSDESADGGPVCPFSTMDAFWLTFKDASLEKEYNRRAVLGGLATLDKVSLTLATMGRVAGIARFHALSDVPLPVAAHLVWMLFEMAIRLKLTVEGLVKWRTTLVVVSRWGVTHARVRWGPSDATGTYDRSHP